MNQPLVSIIIPCFNYEQFVEEAIKSVANQTYKNVEIIVINDGSTDNSDKVIKQLQTAYGFKYVTQQNRGIIPTRNRGVELATGDFIIQLDADDYVDSTYIDKCLNTAEKFKADIVYTQVQIFGRTNFVSKYIDYDLEKLKHDNYIHATALVRRKILKDNPYDPYLNDKGNEDWDLFLDLCLDGARAKLVDEPLLYYRKHTTRKSRSDEFATVFKEMLVRHHVWNKQNTKHPDQFWYFSSQIENLLSMIHLHEAYNSQEQEIRGMSSRIKNLEEMSLLRFMIHRLERFKSR